MKIKVKWKMVRLVLYVAVFCSLMPLTKVVAFPNVRGFGGFSGGLVLRQVRFTGTFYPPGELKWKPGMETLRVDFPDGNKLIFDVKTAKDLTGRENSWEVLNEIWPPTLFFRGPKNLLSP